MWYDQQGPSPPVFFVSVAAKGVAGGILVSVASKWVISLLSATLRRRLVDVASKGVRSEFFGCVATKAARDERKRSNAETQSAQRFRTEDSERE